MGSLFDFFIRYKYWFVFLFLEAASLVVMFRFNNYQGSVYLTSANAVSGAFYSVVSDVTSYLDLKDVNRQLSSDNVRLQLHLKELEDRLRESVSDTLPTEMMSENYSLVEAEVVKSTLHRSDNVITINKGRSDGVAPEMGVVCSGGVVGVVAMSSDHYSIVLPLINVHSNVSCRLKETDYFGALQWQKGATNVSYMRDVPRYAQVECGDIVETNGFSDIFPSGIPLGKVVKIDESVDGADYVLQVGLFADFATLRNVSVILNYVNPERKYLESKADSLLANN
jgi:rod shape-determining protein MreC